MPAVPPTLTPGKLYRTREFAAYSAHLTGERVEGATHVHRRHGHEHPDRRGQCQRADATTRSSRARIASSKPCGASTSKVPQRTV